MAGDVSKGGHAQRGATGRVPLGDLLSALLIGAGLALWVWTAMDLVDATVTTRLTETVEKRTTPKDRPNATPVLDSVTTKHSTTDSPRSDTLAVAMFGLGATLVALGAFFHRVEAIPLPLNLGELRLARPQALPSRPVPAPPGPPGADRLDVLLSQPALSHLNLVELRENRPAVRDVRVALVSTGLDPALREHPALSGRVESTQWIGAASRPGTLAAAHVGLIGALAKSARILPVAVLDEVGGAENNTLAQGLALAIGWSPDVLLLDFGIKQGAARDDSISDLVRRHAERCS